MHVRELVELAALAAWHGPALLASGARISSAGVEQYWTASKCRLDRWSRSLRAFRGPDDGSGPPPAKRWALVRPTIEEILASEVLTRVWSALVAVHDRRRGTSDCEPIVRSVLLGHLEARHRAMALLIDGKGVATEEAVLLNRLRRRAERWIDLLIAHLGATEDLSTFCIDAERMQDFADELRSQGGLAARRYAWSLTLTSLRSAFRTGITGPSPNADVNERIGQSVLACFPPELFDSTGTFHSLWAVRMINTTSDAQGMIDELLHADSPVSDARDDHGGKSNTNSRRRFGQ